ncbi:cytoplasmic tRNA 2-thiolation protein 2-like [Centruroides sculpturatus]|uniref:cytoplasmic tRNA 2-thiolation protein 2-like n=1 Tax=Centruroides sculpturatus TaxID=218467 RepID=UPI000C6CE64F|nr:cytoplasmic tRNA 2-thiolation protein 2-like [Centruroides sculpturatus]
MCSVEDGNETVEIKTKAKSLCRRCNEKASIVHGKDSFCRSCFLAYCTHKFRGTLGKSKQIKRGEKILIAFSGGMSSSAMLHMIKEGLKEASHKRLSFHPILLFIDETSIFSTINDENEENKEIYKVMLDIGFPSYITRLEMVYHDEKSVFYQSLDASYFNFINYNKEKKLLMEALDSFKSLSSKENFIKNLRYNLIMDIAKNVDCSKIFVGESATLLAIRLLSDLAQGCGANIADETGFVDGRYAIPILRPMREFLNKEIAMYNHFLDIPYQVKQTLSTKVGYSVNNEALAI